jgi:acetyltransferase-like isoleucine patch superfamily enzyme
LGVADRDAFSPARARYEDEILLEPGVAVDAGSAIGRRSWVRAGSRLVATVLGPSVFVGFRCHLASAELARGAMVASLAEVGLPGAPRVRIGHGAWVGARARIKPGVRIGDGAVVGAGAWVDDDVPPDTVVVGRPARMLRSRGLVLDDGLPDPGPIVRIVSARRNTFRAAVPAGWAVGAGSLLDADLSGGTGVALGHRVIVIGRGDGPSPAGGLDLAEGVQVGTECVVEAAGGVGIGAGTVLGRRVLVLSSGHDLACRSLPWRPTPVRIGAGCVIHDDATLIGPLTLGDFCVVPPGAVVVADVPPHAHARSAIKG